MSKGGMGIRNQHSIKKPGTNPQWRIHFGVPRISDNGGGEGVVQVRWGLATGHPRICHFTHIWIVRRHASAGRHAASCSAGRAFVCVSGRSAALGALGAGLSPQECVMPCDDGEATPSRSTD